MFIAQLYICVVIKNIIVDPEMYVWPHLTPCQAVVCSSPPRRTTRPSRRSPPYGRPNQTTANIKTLGDYQAFVSF